MSNRMIKQYKIVHKNLLKETADLKTITAAIQLFKQCVAQFAEAGSDEYEDEPINPELLQNVIQMCIIDLLPAIHKFLRLPSPTAKNEENTDAKPLDPSKSKKWAKMVGCIKVYLSSLIKLMDTVAQDSVLTKLLRHTLYLIPFFSQYLNLSKNLLKRVMVIWSQDDEKNRVLAFLIILRIIRRHDSTMISFIMKKLYLAYIKNCKLVSKETWPMINFMQQSLVELYSLDQGVAYQHAFIFIRQCAIALRNASASTEQDAFKTVYNWQYLQSLLLWARLLTNLHPSEVLKPLIHPLVQVFMGTIKQLSVARYFPLRLHIVKALIRLSTTTNTFIPILPLITDILDATNYDKKFKVTQKKNKIDFDCLTRVSQNLTDEKLFVDGSINKSYELLLEYLSYQSHSIAFPELSFFTLRKIKKFVKKCTVALHGKMMKKLAEKIEETSKLIEEKRQHVNFSVKDHNAINQWQSEIKDKGTPLSKYLVEWKKMKEIESKGAQTNDDVDNDNDNDEVDDENMDIEDENQENSDSEPEHSPPPPKKKKRKN